MNLIRVNNDYSVNEDNISAIGINIVVRNLMHKDLGEYFGAPAQDADLWKVFVRISIITHNNTQFEAIYWAHAISSSNRKMITEIANYMVELEETKNEFKDFTNKVLFEMLPAVRENRKEILQDVLTSYMENENDEVCRKVVKMIQRECGAIVKQYSVKKN